MEGDPGPLTPGSDPGQQPGWRRLGLGLGLPALLSISFQGKETPRVLLQNNPFTSFPAKREPLLPGLHWPRRVPREGPALRPFLLQHVLMATG